MFGIGLPELIILVIIGCITTLPFWKIFSKAGYSGWWSLIMLIPIVSLLGLFFLAFSEWPIRRGLSDSGIKQSELKQCPYCAELIKYDAIVCRYCKRDLPPNIKNEQHNEKSGSNHKNVVKWACPKCSTSNPNDTYKCISCGYSLV